LVLKEFKINNIVINYEKTKWWAYGAQELALLDIKQKGYGYYENIDNNHNKSIILAKDSLNKSKFRRNLDVELNYDLSSKTNSYTSELVWLEIHIIPLFYFDNDWQYKLNNFSLEVLSWNDNDLSWNIIGESDWIVWNYNDNYFIQKSLSVNGFTYRTISKTNFLSNSDNNYLLLFNRSKTNTLKYIMNSINSNEYFTKPKTHIISSAKIGDHKYTIDTKIDNSKYLNMLKYVIYSK
jgi:hypothetical protein